VAGYLICAVTGLLFLWADTANLIFVGRLLQGVGEVPIWALAPALLSLHYPEMKGRVIGLYNAAFHLGLSAGPLFGILLFRFVAQTELAFVFYAGVSFVGALLIAVWVKNSPTRKAQQTEPVDWSLLWRFVAARQTLVILLGVLLYGAGYGVAVTMIPAFLLAVKGLSQASVSLYFSLFYIAISLSQLIAGPLSDRHGRHSVMLVGLLLAAVGLALFAPLPQPWIYGPLALASLGLGIFCVASLAALNESVADTFKGTISGAYYLFWGIGYFAGPLAAGTIGAALGFHVSFVALAGLLVLETLLLLVLERKR